MRINNDFKQQNVLFKSGLTESFRSEIKNIAPKIVEADFAKIGVKADFLNDKIIAGATLVAVNLCQEAFRKYSLPFHYLPPSIQVCKKEHYIDSADKNYFGFCAWEQMPVLKNQNICDLGAVFLNLLPHNNDIKYYDYKAEILHKKNIISSSHFLGQFLHELFHNIHLNLIIDKYGIEECLKEPKPFEKRGVIDNLVYKRFHLIDKMVIRKNISKYATNSYAELFSEVLVKMVTESLKTESFDYRINPMDTLKSYPERIQKFIKKQLS